MKKLQIYGAALLFLTLNALLLSCASIPKQAMPVENFEVEKYLGTWYEVARLDHRFERNMDNVIAQYSEREDGDIKVVNSGYDHKKQEWRSREGNAKFRDDKNTAALKVSFFKPFYSGYNVLAIDTEYRYALVAGGNLRYLWILSREKTVPEEIKQSYLALAKEIGYDTSQLIWVEQDKNSPYL